MSVSYRGQVIILDCPHQETQNFSSLVVVVDTAMAAVPSGLLAVSTVCATLQLCSVVCAVDVTNMPDGATVVMEINFILGHDITLYIYLG